MLHKFETLEPHIKQYLDGKSPNNAGGCTLRKNILLYIISEKENVTTDMMYDYFVMAHVIDSETISKKNFPKIVGKVTQKIPFIGCEMNRKVTPNMTEYYYKELYENTDTNKLKDQIRKYIDDYICP